MIFKFDGGLLRRSWPCMCSDRWLVIRNWDLGLKPQLPGRNHRLHTMAMACPLAFSAEGLSHHTSAVACSCHCCLREESILFNRAVCLSLILLAAALLFSAFMSLFSINNKGQKYLNRRLGGNAETLEDSGVSFALHFRVLGGQENIYPFIRETTPGCTGPKGHCKFLLLFWCDWCRSRLLANVKEESFCYKERQ